MTAEAANARQAAQGSAPAADAILFDATGCQAVGDDVATLRAAFADSRILLLATTISGATLREALAAGADGCLTADTSATALAQWVRYALAGGKVYPRDMAQILAQSPGSPGSTSIGGRTLSNREIEILTRLTSGHGNKQIANELGITEATVKVHLKSLLRKIGAVNRTQAAIWAMNNGMAGSGGGRAAAAN
ncbi:response regulator transcription factor [Azospirillum sp. TSO22-1]|uniref:LuxR C-terminal-related transcriptional regulator n=1 Tax=Azospirillum sp. TSO22-1 TaxID=716789 RepID=UPI001304D25F|nr:response regulator transcription factor [Azospirillum sp. TSO22-1]